MPLFPSRRRRFDDLSEREVLALAISSEEDDARIYRMYGEVLRDVYAPMFAAGVPVVSTDLATAELAKVSANVMLAARISLVNLLAEVCEAADADVADLTRIADSCGWSLPLMDFRADRDVLDREQSRRDDDYYPQYWREKNAESIDGLPGVPTENATTG